MSVFVGNEKRFANALVEWFAIAQRPMPWRLTKDPYCIMVSEFMLQQTQVITVIPYYKRFIERFPTLESLANASESEVMSLWAGLGYYSRARNLQTACRQIIDRHNGVFPNDYEKIRALKGVGDYTVGAILSIAFDDATPAVDGNVMRVFSRLLTSSLDIASEKTKQYWRKQVKVWIDTDHASMYTQGLMELGATVCTPVNPKCQACPVQMFCDAYQTSTTDLYPNKTKKVATKTIKYHVFLVRNENGDILIEQRPQKGLLAGQWQLPMIELVTSTSNFVSSYKHQFSHQTWELMLINVTPDNIKNLTGVYVPYEEAISLIITAHQRLLNSPI